MDFFDLDNPMMVFLGRLVELMLLNMLTLLFCIPIVTAGASLTAMHYTALKIFREEGGKTTELFFRSFRRNLRQGTLLWGLLLVPGAILGFCFLVVIQNRDVFPSFLGIALLMSLLLLFMIGTTAFTLLSRFDNSTGRTLSNAVSVTFSMFPKSLLILAFHLLPFAVMYFVPGALPLAVLFLFSGPAIGTAWVLDPLFRKLEEMQEEPDEEGQNGPPDQT